MAAAEPEPTGKTEKRQLYCKLTQVEFIERATEFARLSSEVDEIDVERKAVAKGFKDRIGGVHARMAVLRGAVKERREKRDVACSWHADWASKSMLLRRDDTGEVIDARTMTADEVQQGFDFTGDERRQLPDDTEDSDPLDA